MGTKTPLGNPDDRDDRSRSPRGGADAEGDEEIVEGTGRARVRDRSRSPHRTPEISAALACKYRKLKLQNKLTPEKIALLDHYESVSVARGGRRGAKTRKSKYSRALEKLPPRKRLGTKTAPRLTLDCNLDDWSDAVLEKMPYTKIAKVMKEQMDVSIKTRYRSAGRGTQARLTAEECLEAVKRRRDYCRGAQTTREWAKAFDASPAVYKFGHAFWHEASSAGMSARARAIQGKVTLPDICVEGLASAHSVGGLEVILWSFHRRVENLPDGVRLGNAGDLVPYSRCEDMVKQNRLAMLADCIRTKAVRDLGGWGIDCDLHWFQEAPKPAWCEEEGWAHMFATMSARADGRVGIAKWMVSEYLKVPGTRSYPATPFLCPLQSPVMEQLWQWWDQEILGLAKLAPDYNVFLKKLRVAVIECGLEKAFCDASAFCPLPYSLGGKVLKDRPEAFDGQLEVPYSQLFEKSFGANCFWSSTKPPAKPPAKQRAGQKESYAKSQGSFERLTPGSLWHAIQGSVRQAREKAKLEEASVIKPPAELETRGQAELEEPPIIRGVAAASTPGPAAGGLSPGSAAGCLTPQGHFACRSRS